MRCRNAAGIAATALIGLIHVVPSAFTQDGESPSTARSKAMSKVVKPIAIELKNGAKADLLDEPIYRFNDPTRDFPDGGVWAFGKEGRPPALLTIALKKRPQGGAFWLLEFTSIAGGPVHASERGQTFWSPDRPGIEPKPIPRASAPAGDEAKRLRQVRDLARRFKAYEFFKSKTEARDERFEMRLLPQPVHRYRDPVAGVIDGAIFLLVYGQNPEIALVIEANREAKGEPTWVYGLARISSAQLHVDLDSEEVAHFEQLSKHTPTDLYGIAVRPAPGLE